MTKPRAGAIVKALAGAATVALVALAVAVPAQPPPDTDAAVAVVMKQLEAFRRNDFDTAYTFASSTIHEIFDRARFERMVRTGYPEIARSVRAVVVQVEPDGSIRVRLEISGVNGSTVDAVYELVREDGAWKINAVVTRPVQGVLSRALD